MNTLIDQALQEGKYTLDKELEQDGFSVTFQATHHHLRQTVLIKTLNEAAQQAPNFAEYRDAFQAEAQRLAMCVHPNIARIQDFFVEADLPYLVMDCTPGQTLHEIVFPDQPLSEAIALRYIQPIGEALEVVHQNGLLHRNITPNHIVIRPKTQEAVLINFSLAHECSLDPAETETVQITSGGFAAIEQYLAPDSLTPATDVYGLAATLYALLTAKAPVAAIMRQHQPLPPPRYLRPELSPEVNQAVLSGMALEGRNRPSTVAEWLSLLPTIDAAKSSTLRMDTAHQSLSAAPTRLTATSQRIRSRFNGTRSTPQLMTGIVPTSGFDRRWLTSGAMVFGVVLTLVATAGLLLKYYGPEPTAPLPATSPEDDGNGVSFWQNLGIPALKQQQSPTTPETSIPDTSFDVLDDPFSQPLQPLIDQAPLPGLLLEELEPAENLNPSASAAPPAKTSPQKLDDNWEAPLPPGVEPTPEASQSFEDSAPPVSEDVPSTPSAEEAPTSAPPSTLIPASTPPQAVSPDNPEASSENPEVLPDDPEVLPDDPETSSENPEVSPENPEALPDNPEVLPTNSN